MRGWKKISVRRKGACIRDTQKILYAFCIYARFKEANCSMGIMVWLLNCMGYDWFLSNYYWDCTQRWSVDIIEQQLCWYFWDPTKKSGNETVRYTRHTFGPSTGGIGIWPVQAEEANLTAEIPHKQLPEVAMIKNYDTPPQMI